MKCRCWFDDEQNEGGERKHEASRTAPYPSGIYTSVTPVGHQKSTQGRSPGDERSRVASSVPPGSKTPSILIAGDDDVSIVKKFSETSSHKPGDGITNRGPGPTVAQTEKHQTCCPKRQEWPSGVRSRAARNEANHDERVSQRGPTATRGDNVSETAKRSKIDPSVSASLVSRGGAGHLFQTIALDCETKIPCQGIRQKRRPP